MFDAPYCWSVILMLHTAGQCIHPEWPGQSSGQESQLLIPIDADLPMEENDENFKPVVEKNEKEVPEMTHKKIPKKRVRKLKNIFNKKTKKVNVK